MKNPKQFWRELQGTIAIYDAVQERRTKSFNAEKIKKANTNISKNIIDMQYQVGLDLVLSNTTKFHNLFRELFIDMDKFKFRKTESVSQTYDTHLLNYNNRFKLLTSVDLYSHSMNVIVETIKLNLPQETKNIAVLLSLLHDFGKNEELKAAYQYEKKENEKHHLISANYAKYKLQNERFSYRSSDEINNELISLVEQTLRNHHEPKKESTLFLDLLKKADMNARENEFNGILLLEQRKELHKKVKESK